MRGYFQIGIYMPKTSENIGTLWRSAYQLGASGIFTIGKRYQKQSSDTYKAWKQIPLYNYENFDEFYRLIPYDCRLIGIEMNGIKLSQFCHPQRAIYLLGAEDFGLPEKVTNKCHNIVSLEAINQNSFNVAVAGSIVMYDRVFGGLK